MFEPNKSNEYSIAHEIYGSFYNNNNNNNQTSKENKTINNSISEINRETTRHFICKKCNSVPLLEFIDYRKANYKCLCGEKKIEYVEKLLLDKIYDEKTNDYSKIGNFENLEDNNNSPNEVQNNKETVSLLIKVDIENKPDLPHIYTLKCIEHKDVFAYYCLECKKNICRKCLSDTPDHIEHNAGNIVLFDILINEINQFIYNIKQNVKKKEDDSEEIKKFKELMIIIIDDYKYFPNYSHFSTIKSCRELLKSNNTEKSSNENSIIENKNLLYIKSLRELKENLNNSQNIEKIIINRNNKDIISSLNPKYKFSKLIELNLRDNGINCIEQLANNKMENLEVLDLACNEIDNSNIKFFFELDFPKLKHLNLYLNRLTDPELLKLKNDLKNLPILELFYIGNNKFIFNENNENDHYNFSSVLELGISRNFFNQKSIKYVQCFILTNLKEIYLSNNNLENLDFIQNLDLPSITEFWLNNNNIKIFQPLAKYKTLVKIEMENNNVKAINDIENFINNFNGLKEFNLLGNNIEYNMLSNLYIDSIKDKCNIIINPA